jgi:ubiquinone/menaquinone biosynthesis C-methylase UbiE
MSTTDLKPDISTVKEFWNARPCNVRHSTRAIGTKEYFDEVEARKYFVEPHIPEFAQFHNWKGSRVLEIGCGIGTDAVNFSRAGAIYTGVELSATSLEIAKSRFELFELEGRLIEGNAESINELLNGETFDMIYSFGVLHHTPDFQKALTSIRSLCHENSTFKFMVYAKNSWKSHMIDMGLDQPEAQFGCPIANTYTEGELRGLLKEAGFNVASIMQDHIFPFKIEKYLKYEYEKEDWFEKMPPSMFSGLEKRLGWHMLVTAVPDF